MTGKTLLYAWVPVLALMLTGCETVDEYSGSGTFWTPEQAAAAAAAPVAPTAPTSPSEPTTPSVPTTPTTPTTPSSGGSGVAGDNTFLWKPVSETRGGRAAVLLPANIQATTISVNGEGPAESVGRHNGNRQQYFLSKTGAAYGANVLVIAVGTSRRWVVPNGGARWGSN